MFVGHVACSGEMRDGYTILNRNPEGKKPLGRPRRRCEENIVKGSTEIEFEDVHWIHVTVGRNRWRSLWSRQ
jgi:hypothetical protein